MKSGVDRLTELFAAYAAAHGEMPPSFGTDGAVTVSAADGTSVNFHYRAAADAVVVWTVADENPALDDAKRLRAALEANHYGTGTRGLTLELTPEALGLGRRLVVQDRRPAAFFDSVGTLDAYLEDFATVARQFCAEDEGADGSDAARIDA